MLPEMFSSVFGIHSRVLDTLPGNDTLMTLTLGKDPLGGKNLCWLKTAELEGKELQPFRESHTGTLFGEQQGREP